jgi:hypothetical protein
MGERSAPSPSYQWESVQPHPLSYQWENVQPHPLSYQWESVQPHPFISVMVITAIMTLICTHCPLLGKGSASNLAVARQRSMETREELSKAATYLWTLPWLFRLPVPSNDGVSVERTENTVRFEVFTAVTMKNGVFWDVMPCGFLRNVGYYKSHMA